MVSVTQISQFLKGLQPAENSLSVVVADENNAAAARAKALPKDFEPFIISAETQIIPAPAVGTDRVFFTYVFAQNKDGSGPCDIVFQDALDADTPEKVWTIGASALDSGISQALPLGILWPAGKPVIAKPVPAQEISVGVSYMLLDLNGFPKFSGAASAPTAFSSTALPKVIRLGGQSNWGGTVQNGTYTGPEPTSSLYLDDADNTLKVMTVANGFRDNYTATRDLALSLEAAYPGQTFIFVEDGQGASGFNNNGGWNDGDTLRTRFLAHMADSVTVLAASYAQWEEFGLVWIQGENDANGDATLANAYQSNLQGLLDALRSSIGVPALPIFPVRLNIQTDYPQEGVIRSAQEAIAPAGFIDVDACEMLPDLIHYTIAGYQCMAGKIENKLADSTPVTRDAPAAPAQNQVIYATDFTGADTAVGTLDDWVQKQQSGSPSFFRSNNALQANAANYPRILRPFTGPLAQDSFLQFEVPSTNIGSQGTPRYLAYLRYAANDSGYVVHFDPLGGRARFGYQENYLTDSFLPVGYSNMSTAYDPTKDYVIQFGCWGSSPTTLHGRIYEKDTGLKVWDQVETDSQAAVQSQAGVFGFSTFKGHGGGVPVSVNMRFDNAEWRAIDDATMPAEYTA